jgi:hypothetical protein
MKQFKRWQAGKAARSIIRADDEALRTTLRADGRVRIPSACGPVPSPMWPRHPTLPSQEEVEEAQEEGAASVVKYPCFQCGWSQRGNEMHKRELVPPGEKKVVVCKAAESEHNPNLYTIRGAHRIAYLGWCRRWGKEPKFA